MDLQEIIKIITLFKQAYIIHILKIKIVNDFCDTIVIDTIYMFVKVESISLSMWPWVS